MSFKAIFFAFVLILSSSWLFAVQKEKDISYSINGHTRNILDIYFPKNITSKKSVLVFIHGGSWKKGDKKTYWWLGRNMANKGVVTVIINYRLTPQFQYEEMATDCATAIKWVKNNISQYGGNSNQIFVMGHSAGGHLAALINSDPRFFKHQNIQNPIKGLILNDTFGLDMHEYLSSAENDEFTASFLKTFSTDQEKWKIASPLTYLNNIRNPHLILVGEKSYPSIKNQSKFLFDELKSMNNPVEFHVLKNKKHIAMISQMIFKKNGVYKYLIDFIKMHC